MAKYVLFFLLFIGINSALAITKRDSLDVKNTLDSVLISAPPAIKSSLKKSGKELIAGGAEIKTESSVFFTSKLSRLVIASAELMPMNNRKNSTYFAI